MNDRLENMRQAITAMNQGSPHARALGIETISIGPEGSVLRAAYKPEMVGDPDTGVIAGGVVTALLDHACGQAVHTALEQFMTIATLDLRIDYLRAAETGHDLVAMAECYKLTGNVAFVRGSAWDRDAADPFASMLATFMLVGPLRPDAWQRAVAKGEEALGRPKDPA